MKVLYFILDVVMFVLGIVLVIFPGLLLVPQVLIYGIVALPMLVIGLIVIPIAAVCHAYRFEWDEAKYLKGEDPVVYHFTWKFMWPWDNWEDGIANTMYWKAPNIYLQIIYWSCLRNPINNLRLVPLLSCKIDPAKVKFVGSGVDSMKLDVDSFDLVSEYLAYRDEVINYDSDEHDFWYYCWQGFYSNVRVHFSVLGRRYRYWLGWKIYPHDIFGISQTDYRIKGAGMASQSKRIRP